MKTLEILKFIFTVKGKIYNTDNTFYKNAVFEIEAEDREEAKFFFNHGVAFAALPKHQYAVLDMRTLRKK